MLKEGDLREMCVRPWAHNIQKLMSTLQGLGLEGHGQDRCLVRCRLLADTIAPVSLHPEP